ncbi:hypothetical protein GQ600_14266 [Phytophthora cactorum]|nr:hypothetical protein GQ600_14266 [Phytophthora cactorum]
MTKWWKTYEAVLATPIVVLAARKKHLQGLGRLVGRFACVLVRLLTRLRVVSLAYDGEVLVRFWSGAQKDWESCVVHMTRVVYGTFYGLLFVYEIIESACLEWPGVVILTLTMNYQFVDGGDVMEVCGIALDRGAVILDASVLIVMRIGSEVWRNESKPTDLVKRSGVLMEVPPTQMSTLSGIQAERRAVRAKMQASEDNEAARRGRRGNVEVFGDSTGSSSAT